MSRLTAPFYRLSRAIGSSSSSTAAFRAAKSGPLSASSVDGSAHCAGASLMPKYAELLNSRGNGHISDSSRGLSTIQHSKPPTHELEHFPFPMQAPGSGPHLESCTTVDSAVIPSMRELASAPERLVGLQVPILPDNYSVVAGFADAEEAVQGPDISIVAADPENVIPAAPLSGVESIGLDNVELKFIHEPPPIPRHEENMLRHVY